jgi:hypothetical protein
MSKTTTQIPEISILEVEANANSASVLIADTDVPAFLKIMPLSLKAIMVGVKSVAGKTKFDFACSKTEYFERFSRNAQYDLICSKSIA